MVHRVANLSQQVAAALGAREVRGDGLARAHLQVRHLLGQRGRRRGGLGVEVGLDGLEGVLGSDTIPDNVDHGVGHTHLELTERLVGIREDLLVVADGGGSCEEIAQALRPEVRLYLELP